VPVDFLVGACYIYCGVFIEQQHQKALNLPRLSNAMKMNSASGALYRTLYTHISFIAHNILLMGAEFWEL
jgi:hypothetical protein